MLLGLSITKTNFKGLFLTKGNLIYYKPYKQDSTSTKKRLVLG